MTSGASQHRGSQVIGIDLGGTAIKLARFTRSGELLAEAQLPTPQPAVPGAVTMALCEAVEQLDPQHHAGGGYRSAGADGCRGPGGSVCINLPGWEEVPGGLAGAATGASGDPCQRATAPWWVRPGSVRRKAVRMLCCSLSGRGGGGVLLNGSLFTGHNACGRAGVDRCGS